MASIEDILGKVKSSVRSTSVCLDGDLWAEHDAIARKIDELRAPARGKADPPEVADLAKELRRVEEAMRAAEVEFKFRGISAYRRDELIAKYPGKNGAVWDTTAGAHELFAAAAVDPVMTEDQAKQLIDSVNYGVTAKLFSCAWSAAEGSSDVPFSGRAFASTSGSGSK